MTRKTARDFDPEVLQLFDKYVHGDLSRRGFLQSAGKLAAGALSAEALLAALSPNFAQAQQVAPRDPRIVGSRVDFPSPDGNGKVHGYLVRPAAAKGKPPAVLVVHENRGLNPHIEDIARRVALAGYVAYAPDALGVIALPKKPQNLAFAGPDKHTLYVVGRGAAYKIALLAQGYQGRAK